MPKRFFPLALVAMLAAGPAVAAPTVQPYLQGGTPDGMTVMWQSDAPTIPVVVVTDASGQHVKTVRGPQGTRHAVRVDGLQPGAGYGYAALEGSTPVGKGTFKTNLGPEGGRFRFAVVGDTGSGNANQHAVARQMASWKPDFVVVTGDVVYERGEEANYQSRFFKPYAPMLPSTVFYPSLGNHDYGQGHATPYKLFFDPPGAVPGEQWYTFRYGQAQFFGLDSNLPFHPGSEQYAWLKRQLEASASPWKFAFFHHPPYSSGAHGSSHTLRKAWGPLFEQHDVQLVLTGHDHHYERITPREDFVKDGTPTTYLVTGGGGAWLRKYKPQAFTAKGALAYHFVGITVEGDTLTAEAIAKDGSVIDRFTIRR